MRELAKPLVNHRVPLNEFAFTVSAKSEPMVQMWKQDVQFLLQF